MDRELLFGSLSHAAANGRGALPQMLSTLPHREPLQRQKPPGASVPQHFAPLLQTNAAMHSVDDSLVLLHLRIACLDRELLFGPLSRAAANDRGVLPQMLSNFEHLRQKDSQQKQQAPREAAHHELPVSVPSTPQLLHPNAVDLPQQPLRLHALDHSTSSHPSYGARAMICSRAVPA